MPNKFCLTPPSVSSLVLRHSFDIRASTFVIFFGAPMVRLAHLSDIHITAPLTDWARADWLNKRLAAWFNFRVLGRRKRFRHANDVLTQLMKELDSRQIDHVVFSGDATALGFKGEFEKAAEILGVGKRPGLAVPGNHDYCTIPAARSGYFEKAFSPWLKGRRVDNEMYPFSQRVGDVWLIGVNTATGNRWAWDASGAAGPAQSQRLERLLAELEPGPRILVTHFPVCVASGKAERRTHGLRDLQRLVQVATKGGVSLWLHGHRHGFYHFQKPPFASFPVVCAGSSTQTGLWSYAEVTIEGKRAMVLRRVYRISKRAFENGESVELELT